MFFRDRDDTSPFEISIDAANLFGLAAVVVRAVVEGLDEFGVVSVADIAEGLDELGVISETILEKSKMMLSEFPVNSIAAQDDSGISSITDEDVTSFGLSLQFPSGPFFFPF